MSETLQWRHKARNEKAKDDIITDFSDVFLRAAVRSVSHHCMLLLFANCLFAIVVLKGVKESDKRQKESPPVESRGSE